MLRSNGCVVKQWQRNIIVPQGRKQKTRGDSIMAPPHNFDQLVCTHRMEKVGFGVPPVVSKCDLMEVIKGKSGGE